MRLHVFLLVTVMFALCAVEQADGWPRIRIRLRRVWDAVKRPICRWAVSKVCTVIGCAYTGPYGCIASKYACSWASKRICGKRRRRELFEKTLRKNEHLIPLPALFEAYDIDGDGKICVQELAMAAGLDELETLNVAFPLCDTNGDGFISRAEFINSPLIVEDPDDIIEERKDVAELVGDKGKEGLRKDDNTATYLDSSLGSVENNTSEASSENKDLTSQMRNVVHAANINEKEIKPNDPPGDDRSESYMDSDANDDEEEKDSGKSDEK